MMNRTRSAAQDDSASSAQRPDRADRIEARSLVRLLGAAAALACLVAHAADYVPLPGGPFRSVLPTGDGSERVTVERFWMRATPVTNGEFRRFAQAHPEWRAGSPPAVFADARYLHHWAAPTMAAVSSADHASPRASGAEIAGADAARPVTSVSWFAARAFCAAEGARLPTWYEWEYAAAADATRPDARDDPGWTARILSWYSRPSDRPPEPVGGEPDVYGVRDLHGLVWEWVDDFSALLVSADSRDQNDPDKSAFCGSGAIGLRDAKNYAILMRIAMLSALRAADTTDNLGFRCVRSSGAHAGTGEQGR